MLSLVGDGFAKLQMLQIDVLLLQIELNNFAWKNNLFIFKIMYNHSGDFFSLKEKLVVPSDIFSVIPFL